MHSNVKVWDEITYPFPNSNGGTAEVWEWICNFIPNFIMDVIGWSKFSHIQGRWKYILIFTENTSFNPVKHHDLNKMAIFLQTGSLKVFY